MEKEQLFQVPATVTKVSSMSGRSLRLQVDTQENLSDEQMSKIMSLFDKYGYFCFLADDREIDTLDLIDIPPLKKREEDNKSPAQKLRAVLYVFWSQNGEQGDFEVFYRSKMDKFINAVKEKLT